MFGVVARQELWKAYNNFWSRLVLTFVLAFTIVSLGNLYTLRNQTPSVNTMDQYVDFLNNMQWGALALAAVMAGPALLEDARRGALELYLTRAVNRTDYLTGKIVAVFALTSLTVLVPAFIYWGSAYFFFDQQPEHWNTALWPAFLYGLLWALLCSGLGLGLSCVGRSSRGATLVLLGGFAVAHVFISNLLEGITKNPELQILSPLAGIQQQVGWLFDLPLPYKFPVWWGVAQWAGLVIVGWGLVAWRHPRARGEEPVGA